LEETLKPLARERERAGKPVDPSKIFYGGKELEVEGRAEEVAARAIDLSFPTFDVGKKLVDHNSEIALVELVNRGELKPHTAARELEIFKKDVEPQKDIFPSLYEKAKNLEILPSKAKDVIYKRSFTPSFTAEDADVELVEGGKEPEVDPVIYQALKNVLSYKLIRDLTLHCRKHNRTGNRSWRKP